MNDVVIRGARVVDGTGNPWFYGDVVLDRGKIAAIAPPGSVQDAGELLDASGCVVCPGFIDILSHSIVPLMSDGRALSKITQGVTTEIMGESWTPAPVGGHITDPMAHAIDEEKHPGWRERAKSWKRFGNWLETMESHGVSVNIGAFVGGATIRSYACGWRMGAPTNEELKTMRRVMDECLADGAFGIATALVYPPGSYAQMDELVELAKAVGQRGGVYITHIRSEAAGLLTALEEAIEIGRRSHCPVEIYHLKASGQENWPLMDRAIEMIEQARAQGVDVTADMYPYVASGTGLSALIPDWASENDKLYDNLKDPTLRARIRQEMETKRGEFNIAAAHILPVGFRRPENRAYIGKRLSQIAEERHQPWAEAAMDLLVSEGQRIFTMYFTISEENLRRQLRLPWICIGTDAGGVNPQTQTGPLHPRTYGSYPRILGHYVRDEEVLGVEEAVRKMSGAVAARLRLNDRGLLKTGYAADVVVFDPATITDHATFTDTHQLSTGVRHVWVNGIQVLRDGQHTGTKPGRCVWGAGRTD